MLRSLIYCNIKTAYFGYLKTAFQRITEYQEALSENKAWLIGIVDIIVTRHLPTSYRAKALS